MAKNAYPNTTLQPLQAMDFRLSNNDRVRTLLKPKPDLTGNRVAHVDLEVVGAGSSSLIPVAAHGTQTVLQAGSLAFQFASSQASRLQNVTIVEVLLEGEEFLEKHDVEGIVGHSVLVSVV